MNPRDQLVLARLTGNALAAAGERPTARLNRRTSLALARLEQQSVVAEAAMQARARLIGQATRTSLRTSTGIWAEAELLATVAPSAAIALQRIAAASTVGLTNIVIDASS